MQAALRVPAALVLILLGCVARAQDEAGERRVTAHGFGTFGVVYHDQQGIEYRKSLQQGRGAPAGELDAGVDSVIGLQLNAAWNAHLEAVAQGVFKVDNTGDWRPQLTRLFLRYEPTQEFMLRVGRLGYEQIPGATSRDIGYSFLGIREPVEVFGLALRDDFDGADITLKYPVGAAVLGLNVFGGSTPFINGQSEADISAPVIDSGSNSAHVWGLSLESQWQSLLLRFGTGVLLVKEAPPVQPLIDVLLQINTPEANALAAELAKHGRRYSYYVLSAQYDRGPWQARLSLVHSKSESAPIPGQDLGMVTVGYRINKLTPFVMMAAVDGTTEIYSTGLPDTPQNAPINNLVYQVQAAGQFKQSTISAGMRYDFAPKMDVKFQVDQVRLHDSHLLIGAAPGRDEHLDMTVFGVALDIVF